MYSSIWKYITIFYDPTHTTHCKQVLYPQYGGIKLYFTIEHTLDIASQGLQASIMHIKYMIFLQPIRIL